MAAPIPNVDPAALRQSLEITRLALQSGDPLSTPELTQLLGVPPGGPADGGAGAGSHTGTLPCPPLPQQM